MAKTLSEQLLKKEATLLSSYACLNINSQGRTEQETECPVRLPFQRDRDRIINTKIFRRLAHKSQVFLTPTGDHYRTRLTHTLEVAQIARTIAAALKLNENLTEAIALGHDLGQPPFGHAGKHALNEIHPQGFRHNEQSIRVINILTKDGHGLNLTHEVKEGIFCHSAKTDEIIPQDLTGLAQTLEGQVVRLADIIASVNHDLDDAFQAEFISLNDIPAPIINNVGSTHSQRIGNIVLSLINHTINQGGSRLVMEPQMINHINLLRSYLEEDIYRQKTVQHDFAKASKIIKDLYEYFIEKKSNPREPYFNNIWQKSCRYPKDTPYERKVCDFIAGMTDRYALDLYAKLFFPRPWKV